MKFMKEKGTGLYTITIQSTSLSVSKSLHVQDVSISNLTVRDVPITVEPDFYASTALISSVSVSSASVFQVPVFQSHSPVILPASQLREPETRGGRREEETPGRRGPTRRWQGSATMDRSLRVGTPVLPSPCYQQSRPWPDV